MNEDYLDLDYNAVHTMMVACVNDSDPTIDVAPDPNYGQSLSKPTTAPAALTPAVPAPEPIGADPTNRQLQYRQTNTFVKPVCNELRRILGGQGLKELAQIEVQLVQNKVIGTPVDPMTATPASAAPKGASTKPPATTKNQCVAMSDAQLVKVQQALVKSGQLKDEAFTPDNNVPKALLDYQTAQNVKDSGCKPGQIGSATLSKLIPKPAGQQ